MNRILIPINFSKNAANALKYGVQLANTIHKEITLFHCYAPHEYNRQYDFGKQDYQEGIKEMLLNFYRENIGVAPPANTRLMARAGFVGEKIVFLSKDYRLINISTKYFSSGFQRWMESRASIIAANAQCPVLITSPNTTFSKWENIWHIKRKANESTIISLQAESLCINSLTIKEKSFEQESYSSMLWQKMVAFRNTPTTQLEKAIKETMETEKIDLITLVSHERNSFQLFFNSHLMQLIFQFNIPILVFQAPQKG